MNYSSKVPVLSYKCCLDSTLSVDYHTHLASHSNQMSILLSMFMPSICHFHIFNCISLRELPQILNPSFYIIWKALKFIKVGHLKQAITDESYLDVKDVIMEFFFSLLLRGCGKNYMNNSWKISEILLRIVKY